MKAALVQFVRERITAMSDDNILALAMMVDIEAASPLPKLDPGVVSCRVTSDVKAGQLVTKAPRKPRAQRAETESFHLAVLEAIAAGDSNMMAIERTVDGIGTRAMIARALHKLKAEEKVFQGGERRFARYATTQDEADRISYEARTGTVAEE